MERRKFLQSVAAGAGAMALPLPAFAKVASQAATKVVPFHYGWACVYAQMNNGVSAADIARVFRIAPTDAQGLMDRMLTRGVIGPIGIDGRAHPTRAWQPWDKRKALEATEARNKARAESEEPARTVKSLFRAVIEPVTHDESFGWAA